MEISDAIHSLHFTINEIFFKLFGTMSQHSYMEISQFFGLGTINDLIKARRDKFVVNSAISDNYLCRLLNSRPKSKMSSCCAT